MTTKSFILDLAKLVIAASWADGELANDEINALKDLLFSIDDISAEEWNILKMYMESTVSDAEQSELLNRVLQAISSKSDKKLAIQVLEQLFHCDGNFTAAEAELLDKLKKDISAASTNIFSSFSHAIKSTIKQRKKSVLREDDRDDYLKNTIFYDFKRKQDKLNITIEQPECELRKLCFATGLLAHVAYSDDEISATEKTGICQVLEEDWQLTPQLAAILTEISCSRTTRGVDYFRLVNGYFAATNRDDRKRFLHTLFKVANCANKTDYDEIEAIRDIASSLKLAHADFIEAKLTISREDRNGL